MKLLIFADTHQRPQRMLDAVAKHEHEVNACIHLGDGVTDAGEVSKVFPHIPLYVVQGNCDSFYSQPTESLETFGGVPFFFTHGHMYGVKNNLDRLWWQAKQQGASAVLYGHTHVAGYSCRNGLHLFNPGSLTLPRFGAPTYGMATIDNGVPFFEIIKFEIE